jgi:hypothetical protein
MAALALGEQASALRLWLDIALPETVAVAAGQRQCESQDRENAH